MKYITFGRTGFEVSRISMGCNRLGDKGADPAQWPPIVQRALELGVTFFDTSNHYNVGRSEMILGEVLSKHPKRTVIATKVGMPRNSEATEPRDFSAEGVLMGAEESLKRLKRDRIDLYMLHSPSLAHLEGETWPRAMEQLKREGKIASFGISTSNHASGIRAIEMGADFLQLEYDLLDPSAEDELLPLARRNNVGVMVRTPLARGLLSGKFRPGEAISPEQQWRRPTGDRLQLRLARIEQLRFLERPGQNLAQAALRWLLVNPAVHCLIPGARTLEQLEANISAIDAELTAEEIDRVKELHAEWRAEGRW
ncbi:MAG: aldo/keto reductase [Chloroflexota bacterium]